MIEKSCKKEDEKLFKQRLQRVHQATGITFALFMYVAVFFGIFAILLPYIQVWEKPSRHFKIADVMSVDYGKMIDKVLSEPDYPKVNPISIILPGHFQEPALRMFTKFTQARIFNPNTNEEVKNEDESSQLAYFLNKMHYGQPLGEPFRVIFGVVAVGVMFLVISGILLILKIKYKNSEKTTTSKFSKYHRKIFIWTFAPFIIITLTGALMNLGYKGAAPMVYVASKGETHQYWDLTVPTLGTKALQSKKVDDSVQMLSMNELLKIAKDLAPETKYENIKILNWNNSGAVVRFEGYNPYLPFLNGLKNRPYVTLSGVDGTLIEQHKVMDAHWTKLFHNSIFFLHFLFNVDNFTRLFIATLMLFSTFALGFGVLLYLEKKARRFPLQIPVYQGFGKLSLAVMIGVIPATGLLFFLQWLLPFEMENRFLIQQGLFATLWVATFTYSFYKLNSYQTAKEFLYLGGILFVLSPIVHFINSGFSPIRLWNEEIYTILSVDIGLFLFGLILLIVAYKLPVDRNKIQEFWSKRL